MSDTNANPPRRNYGRIKFKTVMEYVQATRNRQPGERIKDVEKRFGISHASGTRFSSRIKQLEELGELLQNPTPSAARDPIIEYAQALANRGPGERPSDFDNRLGVAPSKGRQWRANIRDMQMWLAHTGSLVQTANERRGPQGHAEEDGLLGHSETKPRDEKKLLRGEENHTLRQIQATDKRLSGENTDCIKERLFAGLVFRGWAARKFTSREEWEDHILRYLHAVDNRLPEETICDIDKRLGMSRAAGSRWRGKWIGLLELPDPERLAQYMQAIENRLPAESVKEINRRFNFTKTEVYISLEKARTSLDVEGVITKLDTQPWRTCTHCGDTAPSASFFRNDKELVPDFYDYCNRCAKSNARNNMRYRKRLPERPYSGDEDLSYLRTCRRCKHEKPASDFLRTGTWKHLHIHVWCNQCAASSLDWLKKKAAYAVRREYLDGLRRSMIDTFQSPEATRERLGRWIHCDRIPDRNLAKFAARETDGLRNDFGNVQYGWPWMVGQQCSEPVRGRSARWVHCHHIPHSSLTNVGARGKKGPRKIVAHVQHDGPWMGPQNPNPSPIFPKGLQSIPHVFQRLKLPRTFR